ncbi:MAG TPA: substrate-binding domain-containing protein [Nocardioidaceae bacterium]|nr:substrate-binding domain-containing protein [Nocardioidaceae bacterium]
MAAVPIRRAAHLTVAAVIAAGGLAGCGANDEGGGGDGGGATIALLLPETKTTRYEAFDKPLFEDKVEELCADCNVAYFNANGDDATQRQQVDTAINQEVDVMVLDPVVTDSAVAMTEDAQAAGIPVIAYDRFIEGADYYMSFDNERVGQLQAEALVEAMGDKGSILMLNGSPTDPNAGQFKSGAHSVLDSSGVKILKGGEYDNPDWSPNNAQDFVADKLSVFDPSQINGVYAANDGQAGGVVAALTGAGVAVDALPPITGQDSELAAIQRIVAGEQYMTIFKSYFIEAAKAAEVAVQLANGEDVTGTTDFQGVASFIFDPVVVKQDNVKTEIVDSGLFSVEDICTADYADACAAAGIE